MWLHLNAEANDHKEACVDNMIDYDIDIMWYDKAWKWQEANVVSLSSTMITYDDEDSDMARYDDVMTRYNDDMAPYDGDMMCYDKIWKWQ